MMVLFWLWSWIYLKLLPSTLLMYWLLLSSPLLLVVKIPLHSVEFNHCRSCSGEKMMMQEGRGKASIISPPAKLQAGFGLSQVPWAFSILPIRDSLCPSTVVMSPKGVREESQTEPREDPRMLHCRSVRKGVVVVQEKKVLTHWFALASP